VWEHLSFQHKGCADRIGYHRVGALVSSEESFAPSMPGPPQHRKNAGNPTPPDSSEHRKPAQFLMSARR